MYPISPQYPNPVIAKYIFGPVISLHPNPIIANYCNLNLDCFLDRVIDDIFLAKDLAEAEELLEDIHTDPWRLAHRFVYEDEGLLIEELSSVDLDDPDIDTVYYANLNYIYDNHADELFTAIFESYIRCITLIIIPLLKLIKTNDYVFGSTVGYRCEMIMYVDRTDLNIRRSLPRS